MLRSIAAAVLLLTCGGVGLGCLFLAAFARGEYDGPNTDEQVAAYLLGGLPAFVAAIGGGVQALRFGSSLAPLRWALVLCVLAVALLVAWYDRLDCVTGRSDAWLCYLPGR